VIDNIDLKIVLIGSTGQGKSQLGNFILRSNEEDETEFFKVGDGKESKTDEIESKSSYVEKMNVTIVDTPGLHDTAGEGKDQSHMEKIVNKFKTDNSIDGIIYVFNFKNPRLTTEHQELLEDLINMFSEEVLKKRLKVIITNRSVGKEFKKEKYKIDIQKKDIQNFLKNMITGDDIIFVNTSMAFYNDDNETNFRSEIIKLLKKIYEVKKQYGSIDNEKVKKIEVKKKRKQINIDIKGITESIMMYQNKISETNQKIEQLKGDKSNSIVGTVMTSIFIPLSFGLSSFGVAATTIERNKINRQIDELKKDLEYYRRELNNLQEVKEKLFKELKAI